MADKPKPIQISWEDLQKMGNPENAPEPESESTPDKSHLKWPVKVHYERKGRGGREAIIIKGLESLPDEELEDYCKKIKSRLSVGGAAKEGEIIIQGNQREKVVALLLEWGFKNVKKAGG